MASPSTSWKSVPEIEAPAPAVTGADSSEVLPVVRLVAVAVIVSVGQTDAARLYEKVAVPPAPTKRFGDPAPR